MILLKILKAEKEKQNPRETPVACPWWVLRHISVNQKYW